MKECPFIHKDFIPDPNFNTPVSYKCEDGTEYIFYRNFDGFDTFCNCQFCTIIGGKRDVFECLNESEWKNCSYYKIKSKVNERKTYGIPI